MSKVAVASYHHIDDIVSRFLLHFPVKKMTSNFFSFFFRIIINLRGKKWNNSEMSNDINAHLKSSRGVFFLFLFISAILNLKEAGRRRKRTRRTRIETKVPVLFRDILLGGGVWGIYTWDSFRCRSDASRKPLASIWLSRSLSSSRYLQWGARHNRSLLLLLSVGFYHHPIIEMMLSLLISSCAL